jgi:uncharacterized radical SAM superfamily Fe-S cluster-containing enzyme
MLNLMGKRIIKYLDENSHIKIIKGYVTINNDIIVITKSDNTQSNDEIIIFKERIVSIEKVMQSG